MQYQKGIAEEYETKRQIALLAGASYVVRTINDDELRRVERQDFAKLQWRPESRLFVIRGAAGKLVARFGVLDKSECFMRLREPVRKPVFASLALLHAEAYEPAEFVLKHLQNPIVSIYKPAKRLSYVGLSIGDREKRYSAVLSLKGDCLLAIDFEPTVGGGGGREATTGGPVNHSRAEVERTALREALTGAFFLPDHSNSCNTQVAFERRTAN